MEVLLDADALIKLHRAGVLEAAARAFSCGIPSAVYDEVVVRGIARGYADAEAIKAIVETFVTVLPTDNPSCPSASLGAGEAAILVLLEQGRSDAPVVSDDRHFLALLERQGRPAVVPADLVVAMARRRALTRQHAREALERLRPSINPVVYRQALDDLEAEE